MNDSFRLDPFSDWSVCLCSGHTHAAPPRSAPPRTAPPGPAPVVRDMERTQGPGPQGSGLNSYSCLTAPPHGWSMISLRVRRCWMVVWRKSNMAGASFSLEATRGCLRRRREGTITKFSSSSFGDLYNPSAKFSAKINFQDQIDMQYIETKNCLKICKKMLQFYLGAV